VKLSELAEKLSLKIASHTEGINGNITGAYSSDLLSDVMANSKVGNVWITLQTHINIVAVASLKGLAGIIIVGNRQPQPETIEKAEAEKVTILTTSHTAYETAGQIYQILST
jgi:hypothetical protein